jgi:hypothetical protein
MTPGAHCAAEAPERFTISPGRTCGFAAKDFWTWPVVRSMQRPRFASLFASPNNRSCRHERRRPSLRSSRRADPP